MQQKEEKKTYGVLLSVLAIIALILAYFALRDRPSSENAAAVGRDKAELTLNVAPLDIRDMTVEKNYIGYVTPINDVNILPYINGFLEDILVEGGQEVKQGDTLLVIRQDEYRARMNAAKAAVLQAQADYNNARIYYQRVRNAGEKAMSKTEIDNAKASYLSAEAQLAEARANYDLARVNYEYTVIQAPISGIVGNVTLTRGDYVSPSSQPLLRLIQFDPIRVVFSITDRDYIEEIGKGQLFAGEKIKLKLADGSLFEKTGTYQFADNEINRATSSIAVFADFENADKKLVSNAYVDVIVEKNYKNAVLIAQRLVNMESSGNFVYIVNGSRLDKVKIDIISSSGDNYLVCNGFKKGDYIVLDKVGQISPDRKIKVRLAENAKSSRENK